MKKKYSNNPSAEKNRCSIVPDVLTAAFFPLAIMYYEIVFKLAAGSDISFPGVLVMLLFSTFAGGLVLFFSTLTKRTVLNCIIGAVLLLFVSVPFLVEYFVFRAFKIYYDINTLSGGAGDVMTGFTQDIKRLVLSFDGISKILIFFLPAVILLCFGPFLSLCRQVKSSKRILNLSFTLEAYLLVFILVTFTPGLSSMQGSEYNFRSAVDNFGLLRSICLDISVGNTAATNDGFDDMTSMSDIVIEPIPGKVTDTTVPEGLVSGNGKSEADNGDRQDEKDEPETAEPNPEITGDNVMDIDFASLSGTDVYKKLNSYVASLTPSSKNSMTGIFKGKNLIMISAEAFSAEAIDKELTPTLYRLATKGINFTDYYQPASAGTTGGEYQNVFGMLPMAGGKSFKNTAGHLNYFTMGSQLDRLGYYGKAYHNNDYKYYDRHLTHTNLGYSDGYMGYGNGMEAFVSKKWPESDLEMIQGTVHTYLNKQPFNIYYMSVSGHGIYTMSGNAMTKKNRHRVEHLDCSEALKGYYAAQLEFEDAMTYLVTELEMSGIEDDTVICISTDHFPYGLEDNELTELYGYSADDNFKRDHSRLILWCGALEEYEPITVSSPTSSLDILPTLSNLFGTEFDSRLMPGRDVFSDAPALVFTTGYEWKTDYGTYVKGKFTPTYEDIELPENYVKNIKSIVSNKILYCKNAADNDYMRYLFG